MKRNKGFTMVELLGVIVIIGILTVAVFTSVSALMKNSQKKYYKTQEKMMVLSGKDYFSDSRSRLPKEIGSTNKVYLETLMTEEYIEPLLDKDGGACYAGKSYVETQKVSAEQYNYYYYLECKDYKSGKEIADTTKPKIVFTPNSKSSKTGFSVTIEITDNVQVASFKYMIKNKVTGKESSIPYKKYKSDEKVSLSGDGIYEITAYAIDSSDNKTTKISGEYIIDNTAPDCGTVTGESTEWTGNSRKISISCRDNASGCVANSFSKTFSDFTKVGTITISDKAGNTRDCPVNAYVDKNPPKCGSTSGSSTSWTKNDRNVSISCKDDESGCSKTSFSNNFTSTTQKGTIVISDKAGNETSCPVDVYVDKSAPTCGSSIGASTSWTGNNRNVGVYCSDSGSGCSNSSFSTTFSSTTTTGNITIRDKAGNTNSCPVNVYVDKTPPKCNGTYGDSTSWTSSNRYVGAYCKDDESGCSSSSFSKTINYSTQFGDVTIRDNAGNTNSCSVDAYVDKEAPECGSISGQSTSWTNSNRSITVYCSDAKSGCAKSSYSHTFTSDQQYGYIDIYDKAGNSRSCRVDVYIDKTPPSSCPSISANATANSWTNNSVTFTFGFQSDIATYDWYTTSDGSSWALFTSGNSRYTTSKVITGEGSYRQGRLDVYDAAGNKRTCTTLVYKIDKTDPSCGTVSGAGSTSNWTNGSRSVSVKCSDSGSKCVNSSVSNNFTSEAKTGTITIKDNAGNTNTCSVGVYIDKTKPYTPYHDLSNSTNKNSCFKNWSGGCDNRTATSAQKCAFNKTTACGGTDITYKDQSGGSGHDTKEYKTTGIGCTSSTTSTGSWKSYSSWSSALNSINCDVTNTDVRHYDKAGNVSAVYTYSALNNHLRSSDLLTKYKVSGNAWVRK